MTLRETVTPLILTKDESANIARTLAALTWAREIVLIDSGSVDDTLEIAARFPSVRVRTRAFDHHADQWNFALDDPGLETDWVLALDADYVVPPGFAEELESLDPDASVSGYEAAFDYLIDGRPLRSSLYPPLVVLFRRSRARYRRHGHRMVLDLEGATGKLRSRIAHDDRKDAARWMASQRRYAALEAERLRTAPREALRWRDQARRLCVLTPWLVPLYCLAVLGLWRDGAAGWRYVKERAIAEALIARELLRPRGGQGTS